MSIYSARKGALLNTARRPLDHRGNINGIHRPVASLWRASSGLRATGGTCAPGPGRARGLRAARASLGRSLQPWSGAVRGTPRTPLSAFHFILLLLFIVVDCAQHKTYHSNHFQACRPAAALRALTTSCGHPAESQDALAVPGWPSAALRR